MARARDRLAAGTATVLFLDEIHRFNRAQQDALLPAVEDGLLTLIGATTQNPWYEVNAALVSRMRVWVLEPLDAGGRGAPARPGRRAPGRAGRARDAGRGGRAAIVVRAGGDARGALNLLEAGRGGHAPTAREIPLEAVQSAAGGRAVVYDRQGDAHYDTISAFIKSLRGSDPDAGDLLPGGDAEGRRGPQVHRAAADRGGQRGRGQRRPARPGGGRRRRAGRRVRRPARGADRPRPGHDLHRDGAEVERVLPRHRRRPGAGGARGGPAPPAGAARLAASPTPAGSGNGEGYHYPHDYPDAVLDESLLPEGMEGTVFYTPTDRGAEAEMAARLRGLRSDLRDDDRPSEPPHPTRRRGRMEGCGP